MTFTRKYKKNLKGGKRRKRKTIRKKRKRKMRRKRGGFKARLTRVKRKLRNLRKKLTRRQRGGNLLRPSTFNCNYPKNIGEIFTNIPLNKNPLLPDPKNSNSNIVEHTKSQKGGGFLDDIGLGDPLLNYYKVSNTAQNIPIRYKGGKPVMPADPMHQPGLTSGKFIKVTPNVPNMFSSSSQTAAKHTVS